MVFQTTNFEVNIRMTNLRTTCASLLFAAALTTLGCNSTSKPVSGDASSDVSFPEDPYQVVLSQHGTAQVSAWTAPNQPPIRGTITVKLLVVNAANSVTEDGLKLDVALVMPTMGHGTSVIPQISPVGEGIYIVTDVNLFMAGRWNLDTTMSGNINDNVTIPIDLQ